MPDKEDFDFRSFYQSLCATVANRGTNWKEVSIETGVSQTTLSRMASGRQPDAAGLTALAAWAGLNPVDYMKSGRREAEPMALVGRLLRQDPDLDEPSADALEAIIQAAYERFRKPPQ